MLYEVITRREEIVGRQADQVAGRGRVCRRVRRLVRQGHLPRQQPADRAARADDLRLGVPDESHGPGPGGLDSVV